MQRRWASCLLGALAVAASAQNVSVRPTYSLTVDIRLPAGDTGRGLTGELSGTNAAGASEFNSWIAGGHLSFQNVPAGAYVLKITNTAGATLKTTLVTAGPTYSPAVVDLSGDSLREHDGGRVSIYQLMHKTPRSAAKDLAKAVRLAARNRADDAIAFAKKALAADPQYFEAHLMLGSQLLLEGDAQVSAREFETALAERPDSSVAACDLALAYMILLRASDAEKAARRALSMDSTLPQAHFVLGEALLSEMSAAGAAQRTHRKDEAEAHLRRAADRIPQAHELLDWASRH
jgi:tetratricopeptide (TPR) repeat protein